MLVRVCVGVSADRALRCRFARRALGDIRASQLADLANAILAAPVVRAGRAAACTFAVAPAGMQAGVATVSALTIAPAVRHGFISTVCSAAAGIHLQMDGRRLIPFPICGSVSGGIIIRIVADRAFDVLARRISQIMVFLAYFFGISTIVIVTFRSKNMVSNVTPDFNI